MTTKIITAPRWQFTSAPSQAARLNMQADWGEPFLLAGWRRTLMIHLEVDPESLQQEVPYPLELWAGRAFISLVAFRLEAMRPRWGGRLGAWCFRPIATHDFLNVRTYVRTPAGAGIHFLAEWLSCGLAVPLGPVLFGLPYHHGELHYHHDWERGDYRGVVRDRATGSRLVYIGGGAARAVCQPATIQTLTEWLMERYTAFNAAGGSRRFFRVWHPPWAQCAVEVELAERDLLTARWPWLEEAKVVGANYSPGFDEVWMGRPHGYPATFPSV